MGDFSERRFFRIANRNAANTKESTLCGCLSNTLADFTQPVLERSRVAWRFGTQDAVNFAKDFDASSLYFGRFFAAQMLFQAVSRNCLAVTRCEIIYDGLDQRVRVGVHLGLRQHSAAGKT